MVWAEGAGALEGAEPNVDIAMLTRCTPLLRPLALLYGAVVRVRNVLFDIGVLPSQSYDVPVICVGNITVGGTGKTPHVEYILSLLTPRYRVAVLSRGYKRQTRGLVDATDSSRVQDIGDEPMQLKLKYPSIRLVVDGNRRRAMSYLMSLSPSERPEVVVMDDGMQHRYVRPSCVILLMDSNRPILEDRMLPEGSLREKASARYRADILIATKCRTDLSPIEQRLMERSLGLFSHQKMFFSSMRYLPPRLLSSLGARGEQVEIVPIPRHTPLLLITGIARPEPLEEHLRGRYEIVDRRIYPDHHNFTASDIQELNATFAHLSQQSTRPLCALCTEKDAVRLWDLRAQLSQALLEHLYYLPIEVKVLGQTRELERQILLAAKALRGQSAR